MFGRNVLPLGALVPALVAVPLERPPVPLFGFPDQSLNLLPHRADDLSHDRPFQGSGSVRFSRRGDPDEMVRHRTHISDCE